MATREGREDTEGGDLKAVMMGTTLLSQLRVSFDLL